MKKLLYSLILVLSALTTLPALAQDKEISYIESNKNWHYLYDAQGKKIAGYSRSSIGEVVGWGSTFFIGKNTGFYRIYDVKGRVIKALSINNVGEVIGVSGNTFTSRNGNWIYIWDKSGKKIGTRPAHS